MNVKEKFGVEHLYFYKLVPDYGAELIICCLESCGEQPFFSSPDGQTKWKSGTPDDNELDSFLGNLGAYNTKIGATDKIYCIDTKEFYKDLDKLKRDTFIYKMAGLTQGD